MAANEAYQLLQGGTLLIYKDHIYRSSTANAELSVAQRVQGMLRFRTVASKLNLDDEIRKRQAQLKITLAEEQRQAIKTCLTSHISIIAGGLGTGKTLFQRFLLDI